MRYLKYLQQVGLVSTLLTAGVLGWLMEPLPSEAAPLSTPPSVKLRMDTGTTFTLPTLTLRDCLAADISPGGYNYCYTVPTGGIVTGTGGKQYRIDPNGTPRVRIADKNGQDKLSITGVQFVPVGTWPSTEPHTLTLTVSATLDGTTDGQRGIGGATINATNAGIYKWAVRSSGEFISNDAIGNTLTLAGTGTFSTAKTNRPILSTENPAARRGTKNLTTLTFNISGPVGDVNWGGLTNTDMGQQDLYFPEFDCKRDYGANQAPAACRPTITQTFTATIKGPDTLRVLGGPADAMGVKCTETFSTQQTKQITFLKGAVKLLKIVVPRLQDQALKAKLQNLTIQLDQILLSINTSSQDLECPGAVVLAFNLGVEAASDALTLLSRPSSPGVPTPPHYYAVIDAPGVTWEQARIAAQELGTGCNLATINSPAEQAIINGLLPDPATITESIHQYWVGGFQPIYSAEPGGSWQWINEEGLFWDNGPVGDKYANWGVDIPGFPNQPDNATSPTPGTQNHVALDHRLNPPPAGPGWGWDDNDAFPEVIRGYVTEGTAGLCVPLPCDDC